MSVSLRGDTLHVAVRLPGSIAALLRGARRLWDRLTYWPVACADRRGTGICCSTVYGPSREPHSCCGDCARREVSASEVPPNFENTYDGRATIGTGVMWRRPWSRAQVVRP